MKASIKFTLFKALSGDLFANLQIKIVFKSIMNKEVMTR